jgi:hypothetical protein
MCVDSTLRRPAAAGATLAQLFTQAKVNLEAPLLVLDVGSIVNATVASADECEDYCRATAGCSGYVYCTRADGCGEYCPDFVKTQTKRER